MCVCVCVCVVHVHACVRVPMYTCSMHVYVRVYICVQNYCTNAQNIVSFHYFGWKTFFDVCMDSLLAYQFHHFK